MRGLFVAHEVVVELRVDLVREVLRSTHHHAAAKGLNLLVTVVSCGKLPLYGG